MRSKRFVSILTAAAAALQITSFAAFADSNADGAAEFANNVNEDVLPEQSVLEEMYLEQLFYGDSGISTYADYGARVLTGNQKIVYEWLKKNIEGVADGSITKTVFRFDDTDNIYAGGYDQLSDDFGIAFNYVLFDLPASFYWYDKTVGCSYTYGTRGGAAFLEARFAVSENYADPDSEYYKNTSNHIGVDASKINKAKSAVANAKTIAAKYANKTAYERIMGFKDEICDLTEYNREAASNSSDIPYGDPWQMVWVFDNDASTKVVCEGYSKAFQYLCDLTGVDCYTVNGYMNNGGHMWNIVRLNGKSYAVDVTNCDDGTVGSPDYICLKGAQSADSSGFVMHIAKPGYMEKTISYIYKPDTINTYSSKILTVSTADFDPNEVHVHNWGAWTVTKVATCTENGSRTRICPDCGEAQTDIISKTNVHGFSEVKYDVNGHWHVCSVCKTSKGDKTAHTFTENITKQPTATTEGVKTFTCSCGYSETEKIGVLANTAVTCSAPANGTLTVTVNGKKLQSGEKVKMGDRIVVSAVPKAGSKIGSIKINGSAQTLSGGTVTYTVKGVEGTVAITAAFDYITPAVVKNFKSTSADSSSVSLTWSKNAANTTKYEINYRSSANEAWTTKTANAAATSLTLTGLKPNTKYTVAIRAVNNSVRSAWTYVNGTSKTVLTAPSAASGFKLKARTMNTVSFTWNKVSNAGGYRIWTKAPGESTWTRRANITNVNTTSATVSGLKANTNYRVLIRAVSKNNSALLSNCVYLNVKTLNKPAATANFAVKSKTMTSAVLTWKKNAEATGYRIWVSADGGKSWKRVANPTVNAVSAQITGLKGGTKYIVRMAAMKGSTVGYYSDVNLTTAAKPMKTSGFTATVVKRTSVSLKWNKNVDASSYRIWVSTDGGKNWKRVANSSVNAVSAQINGLKSATNYIVRMAAINGTTVGYYSDVNVKTPK